MRVRILKPFYFDKRKTTYAPNDVVDAPEADAKVWLRHGLAMQDKSLDGSKEVKEVISASGGIPEGMEVPEAVTTVTSEPKPKRKYTKKKR